MYKNYENNLFRIIPHYSALFRIIPHYSALFRIILVVLTIINAESSNGQTSSDNSSDSDALTFSIYSGIGNGVDFGLLPTGIGTEWMYKNVSVNLGIGGDGLGKSIGIKAYNSEANSKNKIFMGFNYMRLDTYNDYGYNGYYYNYAITAGYRHTANNGIYLSPYTGIYILYPSPCLGLNVGYQFKPIHLK